MTAVPDAVPGDFRHILIALDQPGAAPTAAAIAMGIARTYRAEVIFLHVIDRMREAAVIAEVAPMGGIIDQGWIDADDRQASELLANAVARAQSHGLAARAIVEVGSPVETILAVCERERTDLIVMRTGGRAGLAKLWNPSVTEAVVRRASVPVLTIHEPV